MQCKDVNESRLQTNISYVSKTVHINCQDKLGVKKCTE